ncbi:MAG TPA: SCO family protein [Mycobacteriales bacterium]|nr:SCO family protein [Mycobacteriales bacterium]
MERRPCRRSRPGRPLRWPRRHLGRLPLLAAALTGLVGCATGGPATPAAAVRPAALHGAIPTTSSPEPSFTLTDTSGRSYSLPSAARGRVLFLYFGYTHCPDQCPTTMADVATALRAVPSWVRERVSVVFVTTDPRRDSAPVLRRWLDRFNTTFVGLLGTAAQIAAAEATTGIPPAEAAHGSAGAAGAYAVNHFAAVLVYDRHGQLATLYPSGVTPAQIAADLPVLAADKVLAS